MLLSGVLQESTILLPSQTNSLLLVIQQFVHDPFLHIRGFLSESQGFEGFSTMFPHNLQRSDSCRASNLLAQIEEPASAQYRNRKLPMSIIVLDKCIWMWQIINREELKHDKHASFLDLKKKMIHIKHFLWSKHYNYIFIFKPPSLPRLQIHVGPNRFQQTPPPKTGGPPRWYLDPEEHLGVPIDWDLTPAAAGSWGERMSWNPHY